MNIPLKITFRNMPPSKAIEDNVREKAAKLDSFSDRIMSCRVIVEAPHRHHHRNLLRCCWEPRCDHADGVRV